jgi:hypothetical protein
MVASCGAAFAREKLSASIRRRERFFFFQTKKETHLALGQFRIADTQLQVGLYGVVPQRLVVVRREAARVDQRNHRSERERLQAVKDCPRPGPNVPSQPSLRGGRFKRPDYAP